MEQLDLFNSKRPKKRRNPKPPQEFKVVALRDCPMPEKMPTCETPQDAANYWRTHIQTTVGFNPDAEVFVILLLNTRRRIKGHQVITVGILDQVLIHAREAFRAAIISAAHAIVLLHNHPSGDPLPSEADIRITRDLIRAGQLLRVEILDHVIVGHGNHASLRELGHFHK